MALNVADYISGGTGTNLTDGYFSNPVTTAEPAPTFSGTVFEGTDASGGSGSTVGSIFGSIFGGANDILDTAGGTFSNYLDLKNKYDSVTDNTQAQQDYENNKQNVNSSSTGLKMSNNTLIYAGIGIVALYFVMGD